MAASDYLLLMRVDKPIGILLLLWPTLWALWLAAGGFPDIHLLMIFSAGTVLMRSAGCVMNDIFDRNFDGHVERTRNRPIAAGKISVRNALVLAAVLALTAFYLVLSCNWITIFLACMGAVFAVIYPLLKRMTHMPQLGLGVAFSWSIPMAFAATTGSVPANAWLLFFTAVLWPVIYDTMYAMTDRDDDLKIGVKSTAILFGRHDVAIVGVLIAAFILLLIQVGISFHLNTFYFCATTAAAILFVRQLKLIRTSDAQHCFQAFMENNWIGLMIFIGIAFQ
ncbi:MAG TPA: 4-hydroxybenzoate octaprenyltransferase [Gammaproteobacteria bacterium]|jgi:4-hydroxybenzoate polyprenyltransferase|nr:4-hydroxybenzoate octaprenyltransferase [Gammaproteobacteria bacterium]